MSATLQCPGIQPAVLGATTAMKMNLRSQHKILSEKSLMVQILDTYPQACTALKSIGVRYKHTNASPLAACRFASGRQ